MGIQIETVKTDAFEMDYFRFGKGGRTLVILPGLSIQSVMLSADLVAEEYASMADDFTVYLFDRRREIPAVYTVTEMAEDTVTAIRALGLHDFDLFGASQGGMISLVIAIRYPELVRKLVIGSSTARVPDDHDQTTEQWIREAEKGDRVGLFLEFGKKIYPPAFFEQFRDTMIATAQTVTEQEMARFEIMAKAARGFDVAEELTKIQCPVFVIGASDDAVLGPDAAKEMVEKLGDRESFRLHMYDGYGHAAFDTAPDYRERMMDFLLG